MFTVVRAIPAGRVATYGDVARMAGFPRAARAVGNVLGTCDDPSIPAHRVTGAAGALGGYGSSPLVKRQLLIAEGITLGGSACAISSASAGRKDGGTATAQPGRLPRKSTTARSSRTKPRA